MKRSQNTGSSSKNLRFQEPDKDKNENDFDLEAELEPAKKRKGGVKLEGYESSSSNEDDMFSENKKDKKIKYLKSEEIKGQERSDKNLDNKIEAFNMDSNLEEGKFDQNGNFIWNEKDPLEIHDAWLKDFNSKDLEKVQLAKKKKDLMESRQETKSEKLDFKQIYSKLLQLINPNETILNSLARLNKSKNKVKSKNRFKPNKEEKEYRGKIETITELAEALINKGITEAYDMKYEIIEKEMKNL